MAAIRPAAARVAMRLRFSRKDIQSPVGLRFGPGGAAGWVGRAADGPPAARFRGSRPSCGGGALEAVADAFPRRDVGRRLDPDEGGTGGVELAQVGEQD